MPFTEEDYTPWFGVKKLPERIGIYKVKYLTLSGKGPYLGLSRYIGGWGLIENSSVCGSFTHRFEGKVIGWRGITESAYYNELKRQIHE